MTTADDAPDARPEQPTTPPSATPSAKRPRPPIELPPGAEIDLALVPPDDEPETGPNGTDGPAPKAKKKRGPPKQIIQKDQRKAMKAATSAFAEVISPKKRAYLAALAVTGYFGAAARLSGCHVSLRHTAGWRNDPVFQAAVVRAREMAGERAEDELRRRAVDGVTVPTGWYKGRPGALVQQRSDILLIVMLKALYPDRYMERKEIRGALAHIDLGKLPDELVQRIADGEDARAVLAGEARKAQLEGRNEIVQQLVEAVTDETPAQ